MPAKIVLYSGGMPNVGAVSAPGQSVPRSKGPGLFPFRGILQHLLPIDRVRELYRRAQQPVDRPLLENVLSEMGVECIVSDADLARIPAEGPIVVTANHPFGLLDGAILGALLMRVRPDVKLLTNHLLSGIPELHEQCIFVDPFGGNAAVLRNRRALRQAVAWLRAGGMLAMFPAGEVSHVQLWEMGVADPEWSSTVARLISIAGVPALPVFFKGQNSVRFQAAGFVHPRLRTALLFSEFLQQRGRTVEVRIGNPVAYQLVRSARSPQDAARYLRWRTYLLSKRGVGTWQVPLAVKSIFPVKRQETIAAPTPSHVVQQELEGLSAAQRLCEDREYAVYLAHAEQVPNILQELGRLRETAFRAAGEGTGRARDLDRFDLYYQHILLWSKSDREIVGAYRVGSTEEVLPDKGVSGLYTNTLFRFDERLLERVRPAMELGRSFVRPEYQRQYAPLLMLWKGIGRFLAGHPEVGVLFGAVSISSRYCRVSRELIVRFFESHGQNDEIAKLVRPRKPFRTHSRLAAQCVNLTDLQELPIEDIELDGKGVPVLLRQYAKLGGRILSFNVDRQFSDVVDGLVFVDLRQTSQTVLEKYMGRAAAEAFRNFHKLGPKPSGLWTPAHAIASSQNFNAPGAASM